ncbi:unnamed protein product, partial [Ranitomeya imitator]
MTISETRSPPESPPYGSSIVKVPSGIFDVTRRKSSSGSLQIQVPSVQDSGDDSVFLSDAQSKKSGEKAPKRQKMFAERSCSFSADSRAGMIMKKGSLEMSTEIAMKMGADAKILTAALSKTPPHPQTNNEFSFDDADCPAPSQKYEGRTSDPARQATQTPENVLALEIFDSLATVKEETTSESLKCTSDTETNDPLTLCVKDADDPNKRNSFYNLPKVVEREGVEKGHDPLSLMASASVEDDPPPAEEKSISPVVARNLADEIESYMNLKSPLGSKSSSMELKSNDPPMESGSPSQGTAERRSSLPADSIPPSNVQGENQKNAVSRSKTFTTTPKHHLKNQKERSLSLTALVRNSQHGSLGSMVNSLPGIKFDNLLTGPKMDVLRSGMKQAANVASKMWGTVVSAYNYSDDEVMTVFKI